MIDCLEAIESAINKNWYNFNKFDTAEFFRLNKLEQGDMSWIIPGKILAMSSPSTYEMKPRFFLPFFKYNRVSTIIRLNEKMYRHEDFEDEGVSVIDMEYPDGSNPYNDIIVKFIQLCDREISKGRALAVHCRAGLGRTGTLIGLYMMHKYGFDARSAIAWLRLCRPGSVVGDQQQFMDRLDNRGEL